MKADAQRAKAAALLGEEYKPAVPGVGAAWWASNPDDHEMASDRVSAAFLNFPLCLTRPLSLCLLLKRPASCRSHNFLNQKPWHPLNFRNQMKVFEAQEQAEKEAKAKAQGKVRTRHLHAGTLPPKALADRVHIKQGNACSRCIPEEY